MRTAVIKTDAGAVRGLIEDGSRQYRAIPYAADPVGQLRFRAPRPPIPWSGVRDVTSWGPRAAQPSVSRQSLESRDPGLYFHVFGSRFPQDTREDSLTLHVYTPDGEDLKGLPVLVWFHGGGFTHGSSVTHRTYGAPFARDQECVIVSVTHRLGALGYAWFGDIDDDYSQDANVGALDLVAALRWVQQNIASFGGDPGNVTIFGESGGGLKVVTVNAMPRARELFARSIIQSAPPGREMMHDRESATANSLLLLAELGVDRKARLAPQLERLDWERIVAAQVAIIDSDPAMADKQPRGFGFSPFLDGNWVAEDAVEALTTGANAYKPLMIGISEHEWGSERGTDPEFLAIDENELNTRVSALAGPDSQRLIDTYRRELPNLTPAHIWIRMLSHRWMLLPLRHILAERSAHGTGPYWEYLLTWSSPDRPDLGGAFHGLETGLIWGNYNAVPVTSGQTGIPQLSELMQRAWGAFARAGDPNGGALPEWPASTGERHSTMVFDTPTRVEDDPQGHLFRAWDSEDRATHRG
jgi:para-nitrobenzyl esterase